MVGILVSFWGVCLFSGAFAVSFRGGKMDDLGVKTLNFWRATHFETPNT